MQTVLGHRARIKILVERELDLQSFGTPEAMIGFKDSRAGHATETAESFIVQFPARDGKAFPLDDLPAAFVAIRGLPVRVVDVPGVHIP